MYVESGGQKQNYCHFFAVIKYQDFSRANVQNNQPKNDDITEQTVQTHPVKSFDRLIKMSRFKSCVHLSPFFVMIRVEIMLSVIVYKIRFQVEIILFADATFGVCVCVFSCFLQCFRVCEFANSFKIGNRKHAKGNKNKNKSNHAYNNV